MLLSGFIYCATKTLLLIIKCIPATQKANACFSTSFKVKTLMITKD